jgi:lambda family phage portal protein
MNAPNEAIAGLTPGMLQVLMAGEDIKFSTPADVGPNYEAFEYRALLAMCAGMDMPYSSVTGDYTKANYSSERARQLDLRAAMRQLQRIVMMFQMCRPTMRRFVSDAVLAGALPIRASAFNADPRSFTRAKWIPPRVEWVNPIDDIKSDVIAIRSGVKSREEVALSRGMTLEELDAAISRSNASSDAHGLVLDSDPRHTTQNGATADANIPPTDSSEDGGISENEDEVAA